MYYLSSKEAADLWGVSARRVVVLCREGRVPGASLVGNSWMIPRSAAKPADGRTKNEKEEEKKPEYFFPVISFYQSPEMGEDLLFPDQKTLWEAERETELGNFETAIEMLEDLLRKSKSPYTGVGALYHLILCCLYTGRFDRMDRAYSELKKRVGEDTPHADMMRLVFLYIAGAYNGTILYPEDLEFPLSSSPSLSKEEAAFFCLMAAKAEWSRVATKGIQPNLSIHEVTAAVMEKQGFYSVALALHCFLAGMEKYRGNRSEAVLAHVRKAYSLAFEHKLYATLVSFSVLARYAFTKVLHELPPEQQTVINDITDTIHPNQKKLFARENARLFMNTLTAKDIIYINRASQKVTNEEMAEEEKVSVSTVANYYAALQKKLGVSGKKEMVARYNEAIEWLRNDIKTGEQGVKKMPYCR